MAFFVIETNNTEKSNHAKSQSSKKYYRCCIGHFVSRVLAGMRQVFSGIFWQCAAGLNFH